MSDINGKGHGDKHDWKRMYTPQVGSYGIKYTEYKCMDCGSNFSHYYDRVPDIFLAMKQAEVPLTCKRRYK